MIIEFPGGPVSQPTTVPVSVIADTIVNDVTAYGFNQTVVFHNGDPALIDIGHQLGLGNRLNKIP